MAVPTVIDSGVARNSGGSGICSKTFTVTAGDLIVVVGTAYQTLFESRLPTDTQSNTYTVRIFHSTGTRTGGLFTAVAGSSGSLTITHDISSSGNDLASLFVQVRGQDSSFVHLTGIATDVASSTTWTLDLANTTVANCLVLGAFLTIGAFGTFSGGSGWTAFASQSSDPGITGCYQEAASAGSYDPNGTVTSTQDYSALGIAIAGPSQTFTPRAMLLGAG